MSENIELTESKEKQTDLEVLAKNARTLHAVGHELLHAFNALTTEEKAKVTGYESIYNNALKERDSSPFDLEKKQEAVDKIVNDIQAKAEKLSKTLRSIGAVAWKANSERHKFEKDDYVMVNQIEKTFENSREILQKIENVLNKHGDRSADLLIDVVKSKKLIKQVNEELEKSDRGILNEYARGYQDRLSDFGTHSDRTEHRTAHYDATKKFRRESIESAKSQIPGFAEREATREEARAKNTSPVIG